MEMSADYSTVSLSSSLEENINIFSNIFKNDVALRKRVLKAANDMRFCLFYFDGMVSNNAVTEAIVKPLLKITDVVSGEKAEYICQRVIFAGEVTVQTSVPEILRSVLYGDALILIENSNKAVTVNAKGWRTRGISEPENERILQGPREGFDEAVMLNLAMLRRKLLTPDLAVEATRIGRRTDTFVFICYLDSLVNKKTLALLRKRLSKIDIDGLLDTNYINEQIRDKKGSLFKTTGMTERPDIVAANLLEGRIAILVDGTPVALTLPYLFSENFQADEDYYINYKMASVGRILRMICFFLSIAVPAGYLSIVIFHLNLLPSAFALSIIGAREGVPFSPLAECVLLILIFEVLKEAGLRMPQNVGHALSIVGGLVVGQAAVEAKIVSAPMLIAVALSGISGLMLPRLKTAIFYYRIALTALSFFLGLYGLQLGLILILMSILSTTSFEIDYTGDINRPSFESLKDTFIRASWTRMVKRPNIQKNDIKRKSENENN